VSNQPEVAEGGVPEQPLTESPSVRAAGGDVSAPANGRESVEGYSRGPNIMLGLGGPVALADDV
jgi:hypothetical protein